MEKKKRAITSKTLPVPVITLNGEGRDTWIDTVAVEEPLEIRISHRGELHSVSITMRTPGHDGELAVGFLFGEGIVRRTSDVIDLDSNPNSDCGKQNIVTVTLADDLAFDEESLSRHFYTSSSCGICGKASLEAVEVLNDLEEMEAVDEVDPQVVYRLPEVLSGSQELFDKTGGLHAAALFDQTGNLVAVREDVGRHNAMDKLLGSRLLAGHMPLDKSIVLVSGRASFELVQKALTAKVPIMASVGAPSSLAVDLACKFAMTLVGFLKDGRFNVYTKPIRVNGALLK